MLFLGLSCFFGQAQAALIKTLFIANDNNVAAVKNDILGSDGRFDLVGSSALERPTTLSLAYLSQFDSILYWSNSGPSTQHGDALADYVDGGGHLVLGTFFGQATRSWTSASSRIMDPEYIPLQGYTNAYQSVSMNWFDNSSALFDGVNSISSRTYNGDWNTVSAGSTLLGTWNNGRPLAAINADQNVIALSLFPNVYTYSHAQGDYQQLFRNALAYNAQTDDENTDIPEPATISLLAMMLLGMRRFSKAR